MTKLRLLLSLTLVASGAIESGGISKTPRRCPPPMDCREDRARCLKREGERPREPRNGGKGNSTHEETRHRNTEEYPLRDGATGRHSHAFGRRAAHGDVRPPGNAPARLSLGEDYGYIDFGPYGREALWGIFKTSDLAEALESSTEL